MENKIFDNGDPWDLLLSITANLERLIKAHNALVEDVEKLKKKNSVLTARVDELKRIAIDGHSLDSAKRT